MEQRLSLVTLGCDDLATARAFYARLGWHEGGPSSESVAFYQLGGIILGLWGRAELATEAGIVEAPRLKQGFGGIALAYNVREKSEVDAVLAAAAAAGGRVLKPGAERFWGGYSGYFADPEGHIWEVAWNPHFPIADDGAISLPG
jgi:catechol 2,3-dioxygenase-like lactoylglutathione lyase family enzyme